MITTTTLVGREGGGGRGAQRSAHTKKRTNALLSIAPHLAPLIVRYHLAAAAVALAVVAVGSPNFLYVVCGVVDGAWNNKQSVRRGEQVRWPDRADLTTWTTALGVLAVLSYFMKGQKSPEVIMDNGIVSCGTECSTHDERIVVVTRSNGI